MRPKLRIVSNGQYWSIEREPTEEKYQLSWIPVGDPENPYALKSRNAFETNRKLYFSLQSAELAIDKLKDEWNKNLVNWKTVKEYD
jgi:hypothetical protein